MLAVEIGSIDPVEKPRDLVPQGKTGFKPKLAAEAGHQSTLSRDEIGVNGASLYHHFRNKEEILQGVRLLVMRKSHIGEPADESESWQEFVRRAVVGYCQVLLDHPNVAPLMGPTALLRPFSLVVRDRAAAKLLAQGVPAELVLPIIDSMETLAYGSAILNRGPLSTRQRLDIQPSDDVPALEHVVEAAPHPPEFFLRLQLDALLDGWTAQIARYEKADD